MEETPPFRDAPSGTGKQATRREVMGANDDRSGVCGEIRQMRVEALCVRGGDIIVAPFPSYELRISP